MEDLKKISVEEIEKMGEKDVIGASIDSAEIKEHQIYFVELGGAFGFSALVFKDGNQIKYANDYELHYRNKTKEELKEIYKRRFNNILYTDEEIKEPLKNYNEYDSKKFYLMNYYGLRKKGVPIFRFFASKEDETAYKEEIKNLIFDAVALAYYDDSDFVKRHMELWRALQDRFDETKNDFEYQKSAFIYELGNHEYHINNYQGDWDTLSAFGNIEWHGQGAEARKEYYKELNFNEMQIKAFEAARKEFLQMAIKNNWY